MDGEPCGAGIGVWVDLPSPAGARARYVRWGHCAGEIHAQGDGGTMVIGYYCDEYSN